MGTEGGKEDEADADGGESGEGTGTAELSLFGGTGVGEVVKAACMVRGCSDSEKMIHGDCGRGKKERRRVSEAYRNGASCGTGNFKIHLFFMMLCAY